MIIPDKNRKAISKYLFQEGVCTAKKDYNLAKHPEINVPNLQVIKLMQSFKSKEYVKETFTWMSYDWYLTNDGIEFLRTYLNLPSDIVPATLKKSAKPLGRPMGSDRPRVPPGDRPRFGDRDGYRGGDKGEAPADYLPAFNWLPLGHEELAVCEDIDQVRGVMEKYPLSNLYLPSYLMERAKCISFTMVCSSHT